MKKGNSLTRAVIQMDLHGNQIAVFDQVTIAAKETKTNKGDISSCCRGKKKTANGFTWKYDNSKLKLKSDPLDKLLDFL